MPASSEPSRTKYQVLSKLGRTKYQPMSCRQRNLAAPTSGHGYHSPQISAVYEQIIQIVQITPCVDTPHSLCRHTPLTVSTHPTHYVDTPHSPVPTHPLTCVDTPHHSTISREQPFKNTILVNPLFSQSAGNKKNREPSIFHNLLEV